MKQESKDYNKDKIFLEAFLKTKGYEGKYSNHPEDSGGETFHGIARNYHPDWVGWEIIDDLKTNNELNNIPHDKYFVLNNLTKEFYYKHYWLNKRIELDKVSEYFPRLSVELFDIAVNMGVNTSSTFLQRALNILNRDEKNYKDLKVDGYIGKKTFKILDIYSKMRRSDYYIFKLVCLLKGKYYIDIVENNDSQEVFIRGWLKRVHLI